MNGKLSNDLASASASLTISSGNNLTTSSVVPAAILSLMKVVAFSWIATISLTVPACLSMKSCDATTTQHG